MSKNKKAIEKIIRDRLDKTKDCTFKKAFIPAGWAIIKMDIFIEELAEEIEQMQKKNKNKNV